MVIGEGLGTCVPITLMDCTVLFFSLATPLRTPKRSLGPSRPTPTVINSLGVTHMPSPHTHVPSARHESFFLSDGASLCSCSCVQARRCGADWRYGAPVPFRRVATKWVKITRKPRISVSFWSLVLTARLKVEPCGVHQHCIYTLTSANNTLDALQCSRAPFTCIASRCRPLSLQETKLT